MEIAEKPEGFVIAVENISLLGSKSGNSRRDFLRGVVSAGAFVLAAHYLPGEVFAATSAAGTPNGVADVGLKGPLSPSVYLAIDTDGTVYAIAHRSETARTRCAARSILCAKPELQRA